jgi:hypothetical protein
MRCVLMTTDLDVIRECKEWPREPEDELLPVDQSWPANVRTRASISRSSVDGLDFVSRSWRAKDSWSVNAETTVSSLNFKYRHKSTWKWDCDSEKPFPFDVDDGSMWDYITGEWNGLVVWGSLGHFFKAVAWGNRKMALKMIDELEWLNVIDAQDAMISRLLIA